MTPGLCDDGTLNLPDCFQGKNRIFGHWTKKVGCIYAVLKSVAKKGDDPFLQISYTFSFSAWARCERKRKREGEKSTCPEGSRLSEEPDSTGSHGFLATLREQEALQKV